jgi:hypothetical protein
VNAESPRMHEELEKDEAVRIVAASAQRLFPIVSQQQAREIAALILRDLKAQDIRLVRHQRHLHPDLLRETSI